MNNSRIVCVIQARTGSTRLPNKILLPLAGKPLLIRMSERVMRSALIDETIIATTSDPEDDIVADLCKENNLKCYRGSVNDLLDRHYNAALECKADIIVKIPSDCPLIDPDIIDKVLRFYKNNSDRFDYVSNLHPATYPDGNDVEVMPMVVLQQALKNSTSKMEREHTTPYIWERPEKFRIGNVEWETELNYSMSHRWTIDYSQDYDLIKNIYEILYRVNPFFGINDILSLLNCNPSLQKINSDLAGVNWYRNHLAELKTVTKDQTKIK
ncbi:glycosyltransferase family protein [soil metagenome]